MLNYNKILYNVIHCEMYFIKIIGAIFFNSKRSTI